MAVKIVEATNADRDLIRESFSSIIGSDGWAAGGVPSEQWTVFFSILKRYELDEGDALLRYGELPLVCGLMAKGYLRTYYPSKDGDEHIRNFSAPGQYVGPIVAQLQGTASDVTIEALTSAVVLVVPYAKFVELHDRHPVWDRLGRRLTERFYLMRERHAVELLTMDAKTRLESFARDNPQFIRHVPKKHLAAYLGIRPETLTRLMKTVDLRS